MRLALAAVIWTASLPAFAMSEQELKEVMAAMLNLDGHLCARVVEIRALQIRNQYEVQCIEYRGGSGQVRYIFDASTGKGFKAN